MGETEATIDTVQKDIIDENEDRSKYMLLNRLFKLVQTEDELNDVLAGYFEKLVMSLRKRKEQ
jgi:hypothetical protein